MDAADLVWNRATMEAGGSDPRPGDVALASVFSVHNLAMSAGLLEGIQRATTPQLDAADAGYRWLGLPAVADLVLTLRREIDAGAMDDDERAEALDMRADEAYAHVDEMIVEAFGRRWAEDPEAFAPLTSPEQRDP